MMVLTDQTDIFYTALRNVVNIETRQIGLVLICLAVSYGRHMIQLGEFWHPELNYDTN